MLYCTGWCGCCYANVMGRSNYSGHRGYRKGRSNTVEGWIVLKRRGGGPGGGSGQRWDGSGDSTIGDLQGLVDFIGQAHWEDGTARTPGSVTFFVDDGRLKACVNDKDQGKVCFVTGDTFLGLLEAVDAVILTDAGDWRQCRDKPVGRGRK